MRTTPGVPAGTECSIFIASSTTTIEPACTRSPGTTSMCTTVPCIGASVGVLPAGASVMSVPDVGEHAVVIGELWSVGRPDAEQLAVHRVTGRTDTGPR